MQRRDFLNAVSMSAIAVGARPALGAIQSATLRRVAVIGHTGRGNYGHGLDTVWQHIPNTEIVAVADADERGLAKAKRKLNVDRGYADYRAMLQKIQPEFVSVCPRHADQHHDMTLAAIEAGAKGVYVEKPFCRTPAEADALIAACEVQGARIAVAHRNRYHPALKHIDRLLADGKLGRLLEIRGRGKGDRRGGDEDLWVLGSHVMNLIEHFAGTPQSCSAIMLKQGRRVTAADIQLGAEGLGPLAADQVHARYETASGVIAYYDSIANDDTNGKAYCMKLIGSKGVITLHIDGKPLAHFTPGNPYDVSKIQQPRIPITTAGVGEPEERPDLITAVYNHVTAVTDLIDACDTNRVPLCDVHAGATTVEMICGVFASHRRGGVTVAFPMAERSNALATWK